jgi:hypothetical protein
MNAMSKTPLSKFLFSLILTFSVGGLFFLQACSNSNLNSSQGKINVHMTDSPAANIDALTVNIVRIDAHKNGADSTSGWQVISDSSETVNILNLTNGKTRLIGSQNLDAGSYSQIRLVLGTNNTITIGGQTYPITIPSGAQTGIKINANIDVKANEKFNLLLDFNAAQSVHMTGMGIGHYMLKPVIHAVNVQLDGNIKGTVQPASANAVLYAVMGQDTTSSYADTQSGNFKIVGLAPGTYNLTVHSNNSNYADSTLTNLAVNSGDTLDVGTIVLK